MTVPVGRARHRCAHGDRGQSTVELALALPAVTLLVLFVIQVAVVVHDQLLVDASAREAVRAAAVSDDAGAASRAGAADGLDPRQLTVELARRPADDGTGGHLVEVHVRYRAGTDVPGIGALLPEVDLSAQATMRAEST
jgi:Flp pilus assembly protein TadG